MWVDIIGRMVEAKAEAMIKQLISSISESTIQNFIRQKNGAFVPVQEDLSHHLPEDSKFSQLSLLGEINYADTDKLIVFSCHYDGDLSSRTARKIQFEVAKKALTASFKDGAVFVFYDKTGRFRFSFIRRNYGDKEQKYSNWKRYTYFVEPNTEKNRTFRDRMNSCTFDSLDAIQAAFSVEPLSRAFFEGYKQQYEKFCRYMQNDKQMQHDFRHLLTNGSDKAIRDYVKKMLGRIVFLQFLQKKGWLGVPKDSSVWKGGDKHFLNNLFIASSDEQQADFLDSVLEPMFFNSLNCARENDLHDTRTALGVVKIPYLNGGLFEKDELDAPDSRFPPHYFRELFEFFDLYNFTIDENDPNDAEVGVDPEMLGHIFENLLEDNKDKGAFYTPKEIVHYMCQESLTEYLCTTLHIEDEAEKQSVRTLLKNHEIPATLQPRLAEIDAALDVVRICDPAIGSGAFPMGLLQQIFAIKQAFWYFNHKELDTFPASEVKQNIIQNSIYGVDIEKGAVDIARLRFWLSLVVDETTPQPLPNLDYKIVCGDSLISRFALDMPIDEVFSEYNKSEAVKKGEKEKLSLARYKKLVADYTHVHERKEEFRKTIEEIKGVFKTSLADKDIVKRQKKAAEVAVYETVGLFGERKADSDKAGYKKAKAELAQLQRSEKEVLDNKIYSNSFEWRFEFPALLDDDGHFVGFDIVIGNPPYLRIQGIREINPQIADYYVREYKSATGSFDLYAVFTEKALAVVKRIGIVNFIMPVKWTNAAFGKGLRSVISQSKSAYKIVNFGAYQVFNASTYTGLQWLRYNSSELTYYELNKDLTTNIDIAIYLDTIECTNAAKIDAQKLKFDSWVLTVGESTAILSKLETQPRRIKDIFEKIFQGIATSKDDVYFLYNCREHDKTIIGYSKYLETDVEVERGLVKPLLKGDDVHRYEKITTDKFVVFPYRLEDGNAKLYTEIEIFNEFPKGYIYLKRCESVLRGREKGRLVNDDFWYRYIYPKNLVLFEKEKLVAPDISLGGNFTLDLESKYYQTTTIYGYIKKSQIKEGYKYWTAILNSKLCWWFLQNTGTVLANGYFRFKPDYINPFPIPETINSALECKITILVDNIFIAKVADNKVDICKIEQQIDNIVYRLYDLTYGEVKMIDPDIESKISEVDYNSIEI